MDPFPFKRGKETFGHGIVVAIPGPIHTTNDPMLLEGLLKIDTGVLAASVTVMNAARRRPTLAYGHCEGLQYHVTL